jgi:hypothetical protein
MLRTGKDLPRPLNLAEVPEHYRNNPHILAAINNMPHNMTERGYIVLHDGKSTSASRALGQLFNTNLDLSEHASGLHRTDQDDTTNSASPSGILSQPNKSSQILSEPGASVPTTSPEGTST